MNSNFTWSKRFKEKFRERGVPVVLLVLFSFIFLCYFFIYYGGGSVNIAMNMWPGYSHHTFIALDNDFFEEEGVDVEVNVFDSYVDSLDAFRSGDFDAFFGVYSDVVLLASEGHQVSIVYVADFSNGGDVIMASPDIESISDLRDKNIGVGQLNSFSHLFVLSLLESEGLSESDVNIVDVEEADILDDLKLDIIDAGHTMEPFQSDALTEGFNLLASSKDIPNTITDVLAFRKEVVEKNPEKVKGVVDALFRAERYLVENPDKSASYISKKTGVDSYELKDELKGIKILSEEENKKIFDRNEEDSLYEKGEFISDFFVEKGISKESLNLDELIDPRFVNEDKSFFRDFWDWRFWKNWI